VTRIGIFIFDGAEELDWVGPWEVLAAWAQMHPADGIEVFTFAPREGAITCANGMRALADHTWETVPPIDVLIYPGGQGTRSHLGDDRVLDWLRGAAAEAQIVASVCTGSLVLAKAGLLEGRPATTHWENLDHLSALGVTDVRPGDRFVDTGDVITAAGVSAGIDMALHLIVRLHSPERAREVKRYIQYDPQPPV
jgi:transcriptional regulator GlxA family with amidase domain